MVNYVATLDNARHTKRQQYDMGNTKIATCAIDRAGTALCCRPMIMVFDRGVRMSTKDQFH